MDKLNQCTFCGRKSNIHDLKNVKGYQVLTCCSDCEDELNSEIVSEHFGILEKTGEDQHAKYYENDQYEVKLVHDGQITETVCYRKQGNEDWIPFDEPIDL